MGTMLFLGRGARKSRRREFNRPMRHQEDRGQPGEDPTTRSSDSFAPNDTPTVTLSTATPLGGAYSWNDTRMVTLKDRHAREQASFETTPGQGTRAPQFARVHSSFCPWPLWCGRPARKEPMRECHWEWHQSIITQDFTDLSRPPIPSTVQQCGTWHRSPCTVATCILRSQYGCAHDFRRLLACPRSLGAWDQGGSQGVGSSFYHRD
jgi:hypothetical protein